MTTEILISPATRGNVHDGAPIFVANRHRCLRTHGQMICNPNRAMRGDGGLIDQQDPSCLFAAITSQYLFQRVSRTEIVRRELSTGAEQRFDNTGAERIDVVAHLHHLRQSRHFGLFGKPDREFWFGGRSDLSDAKIAEAWSMIETRTEHRGEDHEYWPFATEATPRKVTLKLTREQKRDFRERNEPLPKQVRYFRADRTYQVGKIGDTVNAILGGQELRSYAVWKLDADLTDEAIEAICRLGVNGRKRAETLDWRRCCKNREIADARDLTKYTDYRSNGAFALGRMRRNKAGRQVAV